MRTKQSSSQPAHSSYNISSNARKSYLCPVLNWAKQNFCYSLQKVLLWLVEPLLGDCKSLIREPSPCLHRLERWGHLLSAHGLSKPLLPLLKHKSIKKTWLSQKSSLCFKQAPLRLCASPQWVQRGCCTKSTHTAPAARAGSHRGATPLHWSLTHTQRSVWFQTRT